MDERPNWSGKRSSGFNSSALFIRDERSFLSHQLLYDPIFHGVWNSRRYFYDDRFYPVLILRFLVGCGKMTKT